jgi:hypothetical protein
MADVFGNLTGLLLIQNSRVKRFAHLTRANGPEQYTNGQLKPDRTPAKEPSDADQCYLDCSTAFQALAATPECSQKGDGKKLDVPFGTNRCWVWDVRIYCQRHSHLVGGWDYVQVRTKV